MDGFVADFSDRVQYYISVPLAENDLKGVGPFIYASLEYEAYTA